MKKSAKVVWSIVSLIVLALLVYLIVVYSGQTQSVLSVSQVNVGSDGKVYWVATGTANNIDEGYQFDFFPTQTYTKTDGSIVKPTGGAIVFVSKGQSSCSYQLQAQTLSLCGGLLPIKYYTLGNAQRTAIINIKDGYGSTLSMDGTITSSKTITASNGGKLTIQTQGILQGKTDCPASSSTTAIYVINGKTTIGTTSYIDYMRSQGSGTGCLNLLNLINLYSAKITENTGFISSFNTYPTITAQTLTGNVNLGSAVFTISGDQTYFRAVTILPPKPAVPKITSISLPQLNSGKSGSMSVTLSNSGSEGSVVVKATSSQYSIYPSSQNVVLGTTSKTLYFPITAITTQSGTSSSVSVEVCSTGQFSTSNCDNMVKTSSILGEGSPKPKEYCGDTICQANENNVTCSADCKITIQCESGKSLVNGVCVEDKTCSWYETKSVSTSYGLFGWRKLFNNPVSTTECKLSSWVYLAVLGAIVLVLGVVFILVRYKRR